MLIERSTQKRRQTRRVDFLGLPFDAYSQNMVLQWLEERTPFDDFSFIATPNVQHVAMAEQDPDLADVFGAADLSLCDSRPLRRLARMKGIDLPLCTGSDMTVALFERIIRPGDRIAAICASPRLSHLLQERFPEIKWQFHVPPMGTEPGTPAYADCIDFIKETDARFMFVAIGAPKSERMCKAVAEAGGARGTALCTGAGLEFMVAEKRRAPRFMQRLGLEWLHRVASEPRRLAGRYASAVPPLLRLWLRESRRA